MKTLSLLLTLIVLTFSVKSQQVVTVQPSLKFDTVTGYLSVDLSPYATTAAVNVIGNDLKIAQANIINLQNSGVGVPAEKTITGTSYVMTAADKNGTLRFTNSAGCTVTFSGLTTGFRCLCHQEGAQIKFSGQPKGLTRWNYTKSQTLGSWVEVIMTGSGVSLRGDLTATVN